MQPPILIATLLIVGTASAVPYPIVDTGQTLCYDDRVAIDTPKPGEPYCGQDAQYTANPPTYKTHNDGTVSDLVTGLMWTQNPGDKKTFNDALAGASKCQLNGTDPDPRSTDSSGLKPFINHAIFKFQYGKEEDGDRIIDSQYASSTKYVSTTMGGNETLCSASTLPMAASKATPSKAADAGKKHSMSSMSGETQTTEPINSRTTAMAPSATKPPA
jgi:hypothetical protein